MSKSSLHQILRRDRRLRGLQLLLSLLLLMAHKVRVLAPRSVATMELPRVVLAVRLSEPFRVLRQAQLIITTSDRIPATMAAAVDMVA